MLTKYNWYSGSLQERFNNPCSDCTIEINPYSFQKVDFAEAVENAAKQIAEDYSNLYLGLSGGLDSEYTLRLFHKLGIPIIPVIGSYSNQEENYYAHVVCEELNIDPVIINIDRQQFIDYYHNEIYLKLNGIGRNTTQACFVAEYVQKNNGVLVTGDHIIGDGDEIISKDACAIANEWDFYISALFPKLINVDLFMYTPQCVYSMIPNKEEHFTMSWKHYRSQLYNMPHRDKIKPSYDENFLKIYRSLIERRKCSPVRNFRWSQSELNDIFKNYMI
jgi:hypothetical protein